ncbi:helix-turn-helix domain-containing protein [Iamia sp. SCSIO 61187]|uniref:helix-turn-helix domain-containing protein n=1 Tax=Iamia sp. SCSIO 61187 TaxID=2722752 RepID=UPI001C631906|nr:helix-turn-helix domain-containing protein [Iamia sp. SCSIO 61187]QYG91168.1 helix-turn-helix domain-containing protein [Iamia sp. SCSIO 61187]
MTAPTDSPTTELPRLLNITQVADHLGVNVRHVRRLVYERRIPFIKWGHLIRFDPADVQRWMKENTVQLPTRPGGSSAGRR